MKRRTPRGRPERSPPAPARPRSATRKPEWNAYLTDDSRYKLSQQQQLQRALQQLSAAHFSARSPAASASASRRRLAAKSAHSSAWSTPQDVRVGRTRLADVEDTGQLRTARRLQFADVSMDLEEPPPAAVTFQEQRMDPQHKASLQGELALLEQMLWELETETERLGWQQTPQKAKAQQRSKSPRVASTGSAAKLEPREEEEVMQDGEEEEEGGGAETAAEERLGDVCYKSLEIGLELARTMDTLKKELDNERRLREDRDLKVEMLEQEVRSTQAKCNYLEAKYQGIAAQVEGMREAVIATEEAVHRITLEYSQRRRGKTSNSTTPSKPGVLRSPHPANDFKEVKKTMTPKKQRKRLDGQENWTPNGQQ
ncbi:uncharacterized protein IUM83_07987 [Phytophthora cinnamomi]|uniref:uncharacterized protein n=1 Tax=Phytophthora cinnamomi TaxID=4785 RepID=UPI00355A63CF|nr:hypothetical protein IUM83_07987 [Phytophthora cinnamomi]